MHKVWYLKEQSWIARLLLARPFISLYYDKILSTVKMRPTMLLSWMLLVNNLYLQNREKVHWSWWGQLFASPIDSIKVSIVPVVRIDESYSFDMNYTTDIQAQASTQVNSTIKIWTIMTIVTQTRVKFSDTNQRLLPSRNSNNSRATIMTIAIQIRIKFNDTNQRLLKKFE